MFLEDFFMDYKSFIDVLIIFSLSIPVVLLCRKLQIPVVVGFLISGIIINPSSEFFNIMNQDNVKALADIGVICLLFSIGLEFSFKQVKEMRNALLIGGTAQVCLTIVVWALIFAVFYHEGWKTAIFYGCVLSLSSTALVLSFLQKNGDISLPYGKMSLTILIYQDIASVLMVILFPLLGDGGGLSIGSMLSSLAVKLLVLVAFSFVCYKWVVPKLLYSVAKTQSRELFMITILFIFFLFVAFSSYLGISSALGAFISGMIIAESPYNHRALGGIMPFKDVFTSIFFVSIGIMLDLEFVLSHIFYLLLVAVLVLIVKFVVAAFSVGLLKCSFKTAFLTGLALSQIGEFSFVLFNMGLNMNLISSETLNYLIGTAILTMVLTPFILQAAPSIYDRFAALVGISSGKEVREEGGDGSVDEASGEAGASGKSGHVVIIGFGVVGRRVAFGARMAGLEYCVIEANPDTVRNETKNGVSIIYGDASQEAVLEAAGVPKASVVALTVPGSQSTSVMTDLIKRMNPDVNLIVRTRFESGMEGLADMGASYVVSDEKETSFEMLARILQLAMVPRNNIRSILDAQISRDAQSLAMNKEAATKFVGHYLSNIIVTKNSPIVGKSLTEVDFRKKYGLMVVTVKKKGGGESIFPDPEEKIMPGDALLLFGTRSSVDSFVELQDKNVMEDEGEAAYVRN